MNLLSCEDPIRVYNSYIGQYLHVPCRKCAACRNNKVMELTSRLQYESQQWKYSIFFTLTYAPEYVPCFNVSYDDGDVVFTKVENTSHFSRDGHFIEEYFDEEGCEYEFFRLSDFPDVQKDTASLKVLSNCLNSDGQFRVVCKEHAQRFIKRLNHYFNKHYKNEKFRYFLVSEYGVDKTKNFRPHYHGLLFFNSQAFAKSAYKILCENWKFGFVGASVPFGKAIGYCAKYINSLNYYPKIYDIADARPFYLSSRRPAIGVHQISAQQVKEAIFNRAYDLVLYRDTQVKNVPFWRSFESRYFPKCRQFNKISHSDRVARYSYMPFPFESVTKEFVNSYKHYLSDEQLADFRLAERVRDIADYFQISVVDYVSRIEDYYCTKELLNLANFYDYQEQLIKQRPDAIKDLYALYPEALNEFVDWFNMKLRNIDNLPFGLDNVNDYLFHKFDAYLRLSDRWKDFQDFDLSVFDYTSIPEYCQFVANSHKIEKKNIKTKKLNDLKQVI